MAANSIEAVAQQLMNGNFDIALLDQVVGAAYDPISPHRAQANKALMQLQESPDLWQKADGIIEQSQNPHSRFFGLQVLDDAIKTRYVLQRSSVSASLASLLTKPHPDGKFYLQIKEKGSRTLLWGRSSRCRLMRHR